MRAGILTAGGNFRPDDPVLRMDAGAWCVRALGRAKEAEAFREPYIAALDEDRIPKDYGKSPVKAPGFKPGMKSVWANRSSSH